MPTNYTYHDVIVFPTGSTAPMLFGDLSVQDNITVTDRNDNDFLENSDGDSVNGSISISYGYWSASVTLCDGTTTTIGGAAVNAADGNTYLFIDDAYSDLEIYSFDSWGQSTTRTGISLPLNSSVDDNISIVEELCICFTSGTLIKTRSGEVAIEDLSVGDMVLTMDHGYQPIRWIGSNKVKAEGSLAPIVIRKDTLGNDRDLKVSPQHRMLLQGWQADLMFGSNEVLATAKSLINDSTIFRLEGGEVEYFHILFDTHEIVWANGCPSESFHPGEQGMSSLEEDVQSEIYALFPELEQNIGSYGPSAESVRPSVYE